MFKVLECNEIPAEVFPINLESGLSPIKLMVVYRNWCTAVEVVSKMCNYLDPGTRITPQRVEPAVRVMLGHHNLQAKRAS